MTDAEPHLDEADMAATPTAMFTRWFAEAEASGEPEPEAVSLATLGGDGFPAVRFVLCKAVDARGFVFYTNYRSRKGVDLEDRPVAALAWRWALLHRQVRVSGTVERLTAEESDAYFATRHPRSQLGAWASPQSQIIEGRADLERRLAEVEVRFAGGPVPRPPWWGGVRVQPSAAEFWQGRHNRLHDRLRYRSEGDDWVVERLAP